MSKRKRDWSLQELYAALPQDLKTYCIDPEVYFYLFQVKYDCVVNQVNDIFATGENLRLWELLWDKDVDVKGTCSYLQRVRYIIRERENQKEEDKKYFRWWTMIKSYNLENTCPVYPMYPINGDPMDNPYGPCSKYINY